MTTQRTAASSSQTSAAWKDWEDFAWSTLVDVMKKRQVGYKQLSRELEKFGIFESPGQLNRKVNRKKFSAAFYLACLEAIDPEEEG